MPFHSFFFFFLFTGARGVSGWLKVWESNRKNRRLIDHGVKISRRIVCKRQRLPAEDSVVRGERIFSIFKDVLAAKERSALKFHKVKYTAEETTPLCVQAPIFPAEFSAL